MEKINFSLEDWINNYKPSNQYLAVFDPATGMIHAVGPEQSLKDHEHKIPVDQETAELILEGKICLSNCSVDITGSTFKLAETRSVYKIDDVLHRIPTIEHSENDRYNIYLTYDRLGKCLTIELTEEYGGTKVLPEKYQPVNDKSINWTGNTDMNFLITDYNDPNVIYKMIRLQIDDIKSKIIVIADLDLPKKFSVYTRRLFKNYVIEHK
jgi:hypothetical protein